MPRKRPARDALKRLLFERLTDWAGVDAALVKHRLVLSRSSLERYFSGKSDSARTLRVIATLLGTTPQALTMQMRSVPSASPALAPEQPGKLSREAYRIAYGFWVEMTTRKIGLPIDLDRDMVNEIYDSWYTFFKVGRDLMRSVPLHEDPSSDSTRLLVQLAHSVLNHGLRPHLERWQAKFRHWQRQGGDRAQSPGTSPQAAQALFPEWDVLCEDLLASNRKLVGYLATLEAMLGYPVVVATKRPRQRPRPNQRRTSTARRKH
jgi:hypothetical protein